MSAVSGALAAGEKRLDLLGVAVIALVTAIGGGTIRDVLIARHPIFWMRDPSYLIVILVATALAIVWTRYRHPPRAMLLIADAFGLALFAISGAQIAERQGFPATIVVLMGTITGVAGGMIRDVLTNEIPLVLRVGNLYASTAIVGASAYLALERLGVSRGAATVLGMSTVIGLRMAAIMWGLRLPVFDVSDEPE